MKTNSWKCCVFLFSIYSGAWQKSHANRIELNCAQNHTKLEIRERAKDQKSERARKWVRCKHVHNTNNDSLQHGKAACRCTMKNLWKNAQLSLRSTTTKAKILKAAHANSHTYSHSQTHIRAHTDPAGGTRSAEYRSLSLSLSLPSYQQVQLPPCVRVVAASLRCSSSTRCWDLAASPADWASSTRRRLMKVSSWTVWCSW